MQERGVDLLRINLSHTALEDIAPTVAFIQEHVDLPICLDTEGAQVRTGPMTNLAVQVPDRQVVNLVAEAVEGTSESFQLTPPVVFDTLEPGHLISVDFDGLVLEVLESSATGATARAINPGRAGSNKAVLVDPPPVLPPLSTKDIEAVAIGRELGIRHFALSFANTAADVRALRDLAGDDSHLISKIESISGVMNLDEILVETDEILIDRGDLSSQAPLESIPFLQKAIIRKASSAGRPSAVATNLLESMLTNRRPTRAEINDIVNTLVDGASALVLAAETAIGSHPLAAIDMARGLIERYARSLDGHRLEDLLRRESMVLPAFHGADGESAPAVPLETAAITGLPELVVDERAQLDIAQIGERVYSPLDGFMTQDELMSVLDHCQTRSGVPWTMPVLLQDSAANLKHCTPGQTVKLMSGTGDFLATMYVTDRFDLEHDAIARSWFGTDSREHPGVERFVASGDVAIGGPIRLNGAAPSIPFGMSPSQTRRIFDIKGWTKVVAFHTRNVPHAGHEHLIRHSIERANADGILIHPVAGPKRTGDFRAEVIFGAYQTLVESGHPNSVLAAFRTYSRFAGPREAVFTALCRKNFGCTHFVLGRDHAGAGGFYSADDNQRMFDDLGDLGITPVFFDAVGYSPDLSTTVEECDPRVSDGELQAISGTKVRDLLVEGAEIPEWLMNPAVSDFLGRQKASGAALFEV